MITPAADHQERTQGRTAAQMITRAGAAGKNVGQSANLHPCRQKTPAHRSSEKSEKICKKGLTVQIYLI
jgi:hypothetical protein